MRFSLTSMIRMVGLLALGSSAFAIGLSRLAPPPITWRLPTTVTHVSVNKYLLDNAPEGSIWLDRDEGCTTTLAFPEGELFDYASCSPWKDERGRLQAVGRWISNPVATRGEGHFGLARVSFPDGEIIERISTDVVPVSSPCWYPGVGTRVLFAAGDGHLYHYEFESPDVATGITHKRQDQPTPLTWGCKPPGIGEVYISDPHWSTDIRANRLVVVALRLIDPKVSRSRFTRSQLWWLRISENGDSIEDAGRLLDPSPSATDVEERCPNLGKMSDGRLCLSYIRKTGSGPWEVRINPLTLDPSKRRLLGVTSTDETVAGGCLPFSPTISSDGRHLSFMQGDSSGHTTIRRVALDGRSGPTRPAGTISLNSR